MRKLIVWSLCAAAGSGVCLWAADWPSTGGNPQRDGWSQGDTLFSVEAVSAGKIKQLWKYHFDNTAAGLTALTGPIVLSRLIGYHGFEELVLANGSGGAAYAVDADLGRAYFKTPFPSLESVQASASTVLCPGGVTSSMVMVGQSAVSRFGGFGGANPIARLAPYFSVSADGYVRTLRAQDGQAEMIPPAKLLPANSNVTGLNFSGSTLYAATINSCAGPNGLYAGTFTPPKLPATPDQPMVAPSKWDVTSFLTNGAGFAGTAGVAAGTKNDMVFGTVPDGKGDVAGSYRDTVLALEAKTLTVKDWFTPSDAAPAPDAKLPVTGITPAVFADGGKDYVIAGGRNGRIYILDATALGGSDHHTPLFASAPVTAPGSQAGGNGLYGTFATSVQDGQRWVYASVHGQVSMKFPGSKATAANGGVVAFKLSMMSGKPTLTPAWASREMLAAMAPATASGLVFALSSGMPTRVAKENGTLYSADEVAGMSKPAVLYILNATTGKEMFSTGNGASSFASSGIAVANGHVYFTTHDNMLYAYGVPEER
ncbi:MAG: PQQ-binding-like beta-propeller repeat protein [Janthinobacterium lividum]